MTSPRRSPNSGSVASVLPALLFGVVLALLCEAAVRLHLIESYLLPAPSAVFQALVAHAPELLRHTLRTLLEATIGFSLAALLGTGVAWALHRWMLLRGMILPWLVVSQSIPLVALAPLLLVWLGFGLLPKVLLVILGGFFPIMLATLDGLTHPDRDLLRLMQAMNASPAQIDRLLCFPSARPAFFSGLKIAATYTVGTALFAEYTGAYEGLGVFLQMSANARATDQVFATTLLSAALSVLFVWLVEQISRPFLRWLS